LSIIQGKAVTMMPARAVVVAGAGLVFVSALLGAPTAHSAPSPSLTISGAGTNADPYTMACDQRNQRGDDCTVVFPSIAIAAESKGSLPAYRCPDTFGWLQSRNYSPPEYSWGPGVIVYGFPGVTIVDHSTATTDGASYLTGTRTPNNTYDYGTGQVPTTTTIALACTRTVDHAAQP
jgi:hypothetical protein